MEWDLVLRKKCTILSKIRRYGIAICILQAHKDEKISSIRRTIYLFFHAHAIIRR